MGSKAKQNAAAKSRKNVPNRKYETSDSEPSACPKCGSTERIPYFRKHEHPVDRTPEGLPATHVVMRYTRCDNPTCQQHRIDRSYENRVK